jgi:hypothetical protein
MNIINATPIDNQRTASTVQTNSANNVRGPTAASYGREGRLTVERSAFDHIELGAKIVIVGITPGAAQRNLADAALSAALAQGKSLAEASRSAKYAASFGGGMRKNLVNMLDHVGLASSLSLSTSAELFDSKRSGIAHFTSALRYPVFIDGQNFNGQLPMLRSPLLRRMIETLLAEEARALPNAIWQPLGDKPLVALEHLASLGVIDRACIAPALPHPSGANAERIAYFLGSKTAAALSAKTNAIKIDAMREGLKRLYSRAGLVGGRA